MPIDTETRQGVKLTEPPLNLQGYEEVFVVRFTGEIFRDYEKYLERISYYQKRIFQCSTTKKSGLTFEEALVSETTSKVKTKVSPAESLSTVAEVYIRETCKQVHLSNQNFNALAQNVYQYLQTNYFIGEEMRVTLPKNVKMNLRILDYPFPNRYKVVYLDDAEAFAKEHGLKLTREQAKLAKEAENNKADDSDGENGRRSPSKKRKADEMAEASAKKGKSRRTDYEDDDDDIESSIIDEEDSDSEEVRPKKKRRREESFSKSPRKDSRKKKPLDEIDFDRSKEPAKDGRPPTPNYELGLPQNCVAPLLQVWSFLNGLSNYLMLSPFSIDDFVDALQYQRDSNLLAEVHVALLRTIFGTPLSGGMTKNMATIKNWRRALLDFLTKPKIAAAFRFETVVSILKYGSYFSLNMEEKLAILEFLFFNCMQLETIHRRLDEFYDQSELLKKEKRAKIMAVKKEMKKESEEATNAAVARTEGLYNNRLDRLRIRIEPLGTDRFLNRYYWFGTQDFADRDVNWKARITPPSAARIFVQYYLPNVNTDNEKLQPYAGAARDFAIVPELEIEESSSEELEMPPEVLSVGGRSRRTKKPVKYADMDKYADEDGDNDYGNRRRGPKARAVDSRDSDSEHDTKCSVCAKPGDLLLCDGCPSAWHTGCLRPPLSEVPKGEWYCPSCTVDKEDEYPHGCAVCEFGGNVICCDGCPTVWHFKCLTPPLARAPIGEWFCPRCVTAQKEGTWVPHKASYRAKEVAESGDTGSANEGPETDGRYSKRSTRGVKRTQRFVDENRPQHLSRTAHSNRELPVPVIQWEEVDEAEFFRFEPPTSELSMLMSALETQQKKLKFTLKPVTVRPLDPSLVIRIPKSFVSAIDFLDFADASAAQPMEGVEVTSPSSQAIPSPAVSTQGFAPMNANPFGNFIFAPVQDNGRFNIPPMGPSSSLPPSSSNGSFPFQTQPSMPFQVPQATPSSAFVPPSYNPQSFPPPLTQSVLTTVFQPTSAQVIGPIPKSEPVAVPTLAAPILAAPTAPVVEEVKPDLMEIDSPVSESDQPKPSVPEPSIQLPASPLVPASLPTNGSSKAEESKVSAPSQPHPDSQKPSETLVAVEDIKVPKVESNESSEIKESRSQGSVDIREEDEGEGNDEANKADDEGDPMELDTEARGEDGAPAAKKRRKDWRRGRPKGLRNYAWLMPKDDSGNPIFPDDDEWKEKQRMKEEKERLKKEKEEKERIKEEKLKQKEAERLEKERKKAEGEDLGEEEEFSEEEEEEDGKVSEDDEHKAKKREELKEYQAELERRAVAEKEEMEYCSAFLGDPMELYMGDILYNNLWSYYDTEESINKFVGWLDDRGERESALKKKLEKRLPRILDCIKNREKGLRQLDNDVVTRKSTRVRAKKEEKQKEVFLYYKNKLRK